MQCNKSMTKTHVKWTKLPQKYCKCEWAPTLTAFQKFPLTSEEAPHSEWPINIFGDMDSQQATMIHKTV